MGEVGQGRETAPLGVIAADHGAAGGHGDHQGRAEPVDGAVEGSRVPACVRVCACSCVSACVR